MVGARVPPSPVWGGLWGARSASVEDHGAAHPGGTAAPAALAKFEQVAALKSTWTLLNGGNASRFPFRRIPRALHGREPASPHVTHRKPLKGCWRFSSSITKARPTDGVRRAFDFAVNLSSAPFRMREGDCG